MNVVNFTALWVLAGALVASLLLVVCVGAVWVNHLPVSTPWRSDVLRLALWVAPVLALVGAVLMYAGAAVWSASILAVTGAVTLVQAGWREWGRE